MDTLVVFSLCAFPTIQISRSKMTLFDFSPSSKSLVNISASTGEKRRGKIGEKIGENFKHCSVCKTSLQKTCFFSTLFFTCCFHWWRQVHVCVGVAPGPAGLLAWGDPGRLPGPGALGRLALLAGPVRLGPALPAGLWACGRSWPHRRRDPRAEPPALARISCGSCG